jgi:hypothetical protein
MIPLTQQKPDNFTLMANKYVRHCSCKRAILKASGRVDTAISFPKDKPPEREADHSPSSGAEVKNCGAVSPVLHAFMELFFFQLRGCKRIFRIAICY